MNEAQDKLCGALLRCNIDDVRAAIAEGASLDYDYPEVVSLGANLSPLAIALHMKKPEIAQLCIPEHPDFEKGYPALFLLHIAAQYYQMTPIIEQLIAKGADPDAICKVGKTALEIAYDYRNLEGLKALLAAGADPNVGNGELYTDAAYADITTPRLDLLFKGGLDLTDYKKRTRVTPKVRGVCESQIRHVAGIIPSFFELYTVEKLSHNAFFANYVDSTAKHPLVDKGRPTKLLNVILGAGKVGDLFLPCYWEGRELEAFKLHDPIAAAVPPYYKEAVANVDMTALSERALGSESTAVARYTRPAQQGGISK